MSSPQRVTVACRVFRSESWPIASGLSRVKLNSVVSCRIEDRARGRGEAGPGGREMPGQDDALVDAGVAEEAVGRLGGGPVLARGRQGAADPPPQVAEELAQRAFSRRSGNSPSPSSRSTQASMSLAPVRSDALAHPSSRARI